MKANDEELEVQISAVVCSYNRFDVLGEALLSLSEQSISSRAYEVIVVDNSSDRHAQADFWKRHRESFDVRLEIERQPGLSRARNIGMRAASAPLVAYLDDDAIASPTWLESLISAFDQAPETGVAGGPVAPIWPGTQPKWLHPWLTGYYTIVDRGADDRTLNEGEWLAGTNIAFRRDLLAKVGGFDEHLGRKGASLVSNEDLVAAQRVRELGFSVRYVPSALVHHRISADRVRQAWLRKRVAWQAVTEALLSETNVKVDRENAWSRIADYLLRMPVEMRNVRGLFFDTDDGEELNRQCIAIASLVNLLLHDAQDPEAPA